MEVMHKTFSGGYKFENFEGVLGYEVAYFSLLDFQPDNVVNVLVPGKYEKAADFVVKPGEEKELPFVGKFAIHFKF